MPDFLITPPTQDVVTLEEAKAQLRITNDAQDDLVTATIAAAVGQLDPASGGWLGRALRPQTWELRRASFYGCGLNTEHSTVASRMAIALPYPPLIEVVSVKYDDQSGVEQTLVEGTGFRVMGLGGLGKQYIAPLYNQFWPITRPDPESVRIRFTCGYDEDDDPDALPNAIKQAVHLGARNIFSLGERNLFQSMKNVAGISETRWIVSDMASKIIRDATETLLSTYRVW